MASDLDILVSVTRANLSPPLGELDLDDKVSYIFGRAADVSSVSWRKQAAESPYVHGRVVVHETKEPGETSLVVYVLGATHAQLETNLGALLTAFTGQYNYQLKFMVEGQQHTWDCERADYKVGFITEYLAARKVPVNLVFTRSPVPVAGSF